jgi:hypothetical protein
MSGTFLVQRIHVLLVLPRRKRVLDLTDNRRWYRAVFCTLLCAASRCTVTRSTARAEQIADKRAAEVFGEKGATPALRPEQYLWKRPVAEIAIMLLCGAGPAR